MITDLEPVVEIVFGVTGDVEVRVRADDYINVFDVTHIGRAELKYGNRLCQTAFSPEERSTQTHCENDEAYIESDHPHTYNAIIKDCVGLFEVISS